MNYGIGALIKALEETLANDSAEQREKRNKAGEFHYIPLSPEQFITQFGQALLLSGAWNRKTPVRFVDVGCGIGSKLILAGRCSHPFRVPELFGIEKDSRYCTSARKLLKADGQKGAILNSDALDEDYNLYDIIYFYCPLIDTPKQIKLEEKILSTSTKGTVIIANLRKGDDKLWRAFAQEHARDIWSVK
jgi:predicted O-methyltransferase YrrM